MYPMAQAQIDIEAHLKNAFGIEFTEPTGTPPAFEAKSSKLILNDKRTGGWRPYGFTFQKAATGNNSPTLQQADYETVRNNLLQYAKAGLLLIKTGTQGNMKNVSVNDITEEVAP